MSCKCGCSATTPISLVQKRFIASHQGSPWSDLCSGGLTLKPSSSRSHLKSRRVAPSGFHLPYFLHHASVRGSAYARFNEGEVDAGPDRVPAHHLAACHEVPVLLPVRRAEAGRFPCRVRLQVGWWAVSGVVAPVAREDAVAGRSEEHTAELQSRPHGVCC